MALHSPLHSAELVQRTSRFCPPLSPRVTCTRFRGSKGSRTRSVAGARIRASLRAACAASGIPAWPRVPGHLSPPRQAPACASRCPNKGREKLKAALSERFLLPFRASRSALAMAAAQQDPAAPVPEPGRAVDPVKLRFARAEHGDGVCLVASLASSQHRPDARAMLRFPWSSMLGCGNPS